MQPRDRVVEVVDTPDQVLGPRGQHERVAADVGGGHGRGDPLRRRRRSGRSARPGRSSPRSSSPAAPAVVQQPDGLCDAVEVAVVGEAPLAVDVEREIGRSRERPDVLDELVARPPVRRPRPIDQAKPALVVASASKPAPASNLAEPTSHGLGITKTCARAWRSKKRARRSLWRHAVHLDHGRTPEQRRSDVDVVLVPPCRCRRRHRAVTGAYQPAGRVASLASRAAERAASAKSSPLLA